MSRWPGYKGGLGIENTPTPILFPPHYCPPDHPPKVSIVPTTGFTQENTEPPMEREVFAAMVSYFLGDSAQLRGIDIQDNGQVESFAYSAWKPLTRAMIRDIKRESGNWRKWQREQYAYPSSKDVDLLDKFRKARPTDVSTERDNYAWSPDGKPYWHLKEGRFLTSSEMETLALFEKIRGQDIISYRIEDYAWAHGRPYYHLIEERYLTEQEIGE
ncbi:hypothetical protein BJ508DRAFT_143363 [Ascobolus immersus RN42]|uniref:Uncharacterized protein n=1 Tax=Ascobolus immersus RN42 TaxID=1160509 RepID=A0A3N4HZG5_ASCIM|nr:hypothetical protein BJ508DRAFT_143363 [Ascobolus immersus RN42]